ncbi:MAG: hypothetical protein GC161_13065 [Planctomycetaceae bacterium]|nr:hypothetical protein [Planctomycetaceae bacterium]
MPPRSDSHRLPWCALAVSALCALTAAAKLYVQAPMTDVAHGDSSFYLTLARNLAAGRGFVVDYIPDFLGNPKGLPHPATSFWMPLVSVYLAAVMELFGTAYTTALRAMIAITSLAPALAFAVGREAFGKARYGLLGALLMAVFDGVLTAACQPQTHGFSLLIGGSWFYAMLRGQRDPRWFYALGPLMGLAHWNRSDGIFFWVALVLWWLLSPGRRFPLRTFLGIAAGYAVVMAPLWWINMGAIGRPMPSGSSRAAHLVLYEDLYRLPENLTLASFVEREPEEIVDSRMRALASNARSVVTGPAVGYLRKWKLSDLEDHHWPWIGLAFLGWIALLRRRFLIYWVYLGTLFGVYTLVLAETGTASVRCTLYATYPLLLGAGGYGGERLLSRVFGERWSAWVLAAGIAVLGSVGVLALRDWVDRGVVWVQDQKASHLAVKERFAERHGLLELPLMALDTHHFHVNTGLHLVRIPNEPVNVVHRVATELGVDHLLLRGAAESLPPGFAYHTIPKAPWLFREIDREEIGGELYRLYERVPLPAKPGTAAPAD